jgi:hypothetical protein
MSPDDTRDLDVAESTEVGCGHASCLCAAGESGYCSGFCEQQASASDDAAEEMCGCGHPDCAAA